jgi:ribosomal protein L32
VFIAPERKNIMGLKFCPNCGEVVVTKALSKYSQRDYKGVLVKRRQIGHLTEDGGCGHTWYTVEVPEDNLPFKNW